MDILKAQFGKRLKEARKTAGLTQEDLAAKMKVEPPSVSRWETGKDFPDNSRLPKLCEILRVDESYFSGETKSSRPSGRQLKQLIEGGKDFPAHLLTPLLEAFLNADPYNRAAAFAALYEDIDILANYMTPSQPAKATKSR